MSVSVEIKILSGGAMRRLMVEAVPMFERASGVKVATEFRLTSVLRKEIEDGATFDIAILPREEIEALAGVGRIAAGTAVDLARSAVGFAVRTGAHRPDISTVDSFKQALLQAATISYSDGPSGFYIAGLLEHLGLAQEMKPKIRLATAGPVAELVARGEAEVGMQQIVEILPVQGADLVGRLPSELQNIITYAAGLSPAAQENPAARTFVGFMKTPDVVRIAREKGLEPG